MLRLRVSTIQQNVMAFETMRLDSLACRDLRFYAVRYMFVYTIALSTMCTLEDLWNGVEYMLRFSKYAEIGKANIRLVD